MCAEDIKQYVVIGMLGSRLHFKVALQQKCVRSNLFLVVTFNSDFILIELQESWQLFDGPVVSGIQIQMDWATNVLDACLL